MLRLAAAAGMAALAQYAQLKQTGAGMPRKVVNGQGTYTFASGTTYTGEFKDDKFNGQGTYTSADGTKRTGEWKDGKPVP